MGAAQSSDDGQTIVVSRGWTIAIIAQEVVLVLLVVFLLYWLFFGKRKPKVPDLDLKA